MPVLPPLSRAAAAAADTRIIDARQLGSAARSLATTTAHLLKRAPALARRQYGAACNAGYIPACYQGLNGGPAPGAVVGIVLGSIAGFVILLWLLWILSSGTSFIRTSTLEEEDVVVRRRSRSPRSRRSRSHRSSYQHTAEMRHSSPRRERDRVVRQERVVRTGAPPPREQSRVRETIIVNESQPERRVEGDDVIEVMEEHSSIDQPPPRRKTRKSSGYRLVDPPSLRRRHGGRRRHRGRLSKGRPRTLRR